MAKAEIYKHNVLVAVEYFKRELYICETRSGELFWDTGENPTQRRGVIKSWIQMADTTPRIMTVLPDWELTLNGIKQEVKFYDLIEDLGGQIVELQHKEYRFIFNFMGNHLPAPGAG